MLANDDLLGRAKDLISTRRMLTRQRDGYSPSSPGRTHLHFPTGATAHQEQKQTKQAVAIIERAPAITGSQATAIHVGLNGRGSCSRSQWTVLKLKGNKNSRWIFVIYDLVQVPRPMVQQELRNANNTCVPPSTPARATAGKRRTRPPFERNGAHLLQRPLLLLQRVAHGLLLLLESLLGSLPSLLLLALPPLRRHACPHGCDGRTCCCRRCRRSCRCRRSSSSSWCWCGGPAARRCLRRSRVPGAPGSVEHGGSSGRPGHLFPVHDGTRQGRTGDFFAIRGKSRSCGRRSWPRCWWSCRRRRRRCC